MIEVDEEGTEAMAGTLLEITAYYMPPIIRVDRPFLFIIYEETSRTVLFLGRVVNPTLLWFTARVSPWSYSDAGSKVSESTRDIGTGVPPCSQVLIWAILRSAYEIQAYFKEMFVWAGWYFKPVSKSLCY